ncbi:MAG: hypothetical protein WBX09_19715, partial [Terracidiphilus sp.]
LNSLAKRGKTSTKQELKTSGAKAQILYLRLSAGLKSRPDAFWFYRQAFFTKLRSRALSKPSRVDGHTKS